jgi:hypothetical protein
VGEGHAELLIPGLLPPKAAPKFSQETPNSSKSIVRGKVENLARRANEKALLPKHSEDSKFFELTAHCLAVFSVEQVA